METRGLNFLTANEKSILEKLKLKTFEEVVYYFPYKYLEAPKNKLIQDILVGENVSISGIIVDIKVKTGFYKGLKFAKVKLEDETGSLDVFWWNMPFVAKSLSIGQKIVLTGVVASKKNKSGEEEIYLNNPKFEKKKNLEINQNGSLFEKEETEPMSASYPETKDVKSFQIKKIILKCLQSSLFQKIEDILPRDLSRKLNLPDRKSAIARKHFPKTNDDIIAANKFFAFEEIFLMQLYRQYEKKLRFQEHAYKISANTSYESMKNELLPFKLTSGQEKVLDEILNDMSKDQPMSRLVEGDVGSGKTALAFCAALLTIVNKSNQSKKPLQVALIAPTEILANQHFEFFSSTMSHHSHFGIALLTGKGAKIWPSKIDREKYTEAPKSRVKKLLDAGQIHIVVGTHALFNKNIKFENLGLIILDEQHRFGVKQRKALIENNKENKIKKAKNDLREIQTDRPIPHLLSMSATPIPRTLALTIYGDLELSILDELPPGRKRATTKVINQFERENMYKILLQEISKGRQAYIIAPRITHNEETSTKSSVEFEAKRFKEKFPNLKIGVLHGKDKEKENTIARFYKHEIDILISTTVVEVGVSIPNATVIIIENAETFGLAQLHQLRGRVERSTNESFCFLVSESESEISIKRLNALEKTESGFELAEIDLSERGAGSLIGNRQSGLTDIGMEAIKNRKLVEIAKSEAQDILERDSSLEKFPKLKKIIEDLAFHSE